LEEVQVLYNENQKIISKASNMAEGSTGLMAAAQVGHEGINRNKRCLTVYL